MVKLIASIALTLLLGLSTRAAERPEPKYQAYLTYRIVTGDPRGSVTAGTQRILWSEAHENDARGYRATPGPEFDYAPRGLAHGVVVELKTFDCDKEQVRADLRIDWCEPQETADEDFIATQGNARRLSGTFRAGKQYRLDLPAREGVPTWMEFSITTMFDKRRILDDYPVQKLKLK